MAETDKQVIDAILETAAVFLDTHWSMENAEVDTTEEPFDFDMTPGARRREIRVNGRLFVVTVEPCNDD